MAFDPIRPTDTQARTTARGLIAAMRHAVLSVVDRETGHPHLSRIACQPDGDGVPLALLSAIAAHSRHLAAGGKAALLIEGVAEKGDPMARPRLSLQVDAEPAPGDPDRRARWIAADRKAMAYIDLPDFRFWRLVPRSGLLVAGFGAAFRLDAADLQKPPQG